MMTSKNFIFKIVSFEVIKLVMWPSLKHSILNFERIYSHAPVFRTLECLDLKSREYQYCSTHQYLHLIYRPFLHFVGAKVDLQTQRANTRFNVKACQPIWPTIDKGSNSNTLVPTTAMRPDVVAKRYSCGTWEFAEVDSKNSKELVVKGKYASWRSRRKSRCWNRCKNLCWIDCVYSLHRQGAYIYTLFKSVTTRHN